MVTRVPGLAVRIGASVSAAIIALACGGGGNGGKEGAAGGSRGEEIGGASGEAVPSGFPFPTRLPESTADCEAAAGSEGCYFAACCAELLACRDNAACATAFSCYVSCQDDSACYARCAGSTLTGAGDDFSAALACVLAQTPACGASAAPDGEGAGGEGGVGDSNVGPLGTATDGLGWNLRVSANPLTAELEADEARAVSKEITLDGGTLSASAADGTKFTLTLPEAALYGPTVITLTPLRSFEVAELPGEAHGVRIEPDGLPLLASPTLEITPPKGDTWPETAIVPLAITGDDQHVSLALVDPDAPALAFALTHFSDYVSLVSRDGLDATVSSGDVRSRFGGDAEERLQSATAERLAQQRAGKKLSELGIDELFREYEESVLKPRVDAAGESCAVGQLAVRTLLGVSRQKQLLGADDDPVSGMEALLKVAVPACMAGEYELCRDQHIITRILPAYFAFVRQSQLLGLSTEIAGTNIPPNWLVEAEGWVKKCLKFELHLDSKVLYSSDTNKMSMNETVTAVVPIDLKATIAEVPADVLPPGADQVGALITGDGAPLYSTAYAVHTDQRCRTIDSHDAAPGEAMVAFFSFTPAANAPDTIGGSSEIADIGLSLAISPNTSSYTYRQQKEENAGCSEVIANGEEVLSWSTTLGAYLLQVTSSGQKGAFIRDWAPVNTEIIATNDLQLSTSNGDSSASGQVHFILFHTPE